MKKLLISAFLLVALVSTGCRTGGTSKSIQVTGSDTMVILSRAWAQDFMNKNPDIQLRVDGGGSSVGIQALMNGTADVANSSRGIKDEEIQQAKDNGFTPKETIIGYDGIVVAVNPKNPISQLTIDQLSDIFAGKITDWKQIGGKEGQIVLLSRETSSGTYEFLKEHVLNKGDSKGGVDFAASTSLLNNSSQIVDQIANNINALGYFGMGYTSKSIKEIKVAKDKKDPYQAPTVSNIKTKKYTISRPLQVYTKGEPTGNIKKYIAYLLGTDGQKLVRKAGFVPLQ